MLELEMGGDGGRGVGFGQFADDFLLELRRHELVLVGRGMEIGVVLVGAACLNGRRTVQLRGLH